MGSETGEFERLAGDAMREFALSRSNGISKYNTLLARFGKGEIATGAFGEEVLKLALEEGVRYAQDAIKLGSAYLGLVSQATRAADVKPASTRPAARRAAAARARKPRARKARARRTGRAAA